ncbi:hypothetical protein Syun_000689 [Stephania yunnanensis]|uniref:Uncharacterized protein n=1 Tax=Stephania yunnanensis TaxID=152371 RepID=A0AAP0Q706_9MAGN
MLGSFLSRIRESREVGAQLRIYLQPSKGIEVVLMCNNGGKGSRHLPKLEFSHWKPILRRARARARRNWATTSEIVTPARV